MKQSFVRCIRICLALAVFLVVFSWPCFGALAAPAGPAKGGQAITVMTQNMDEGTDFTPLVAAQTQQQLLDAVTTVYQEVQASNIPERAQAVAKEIKAQQPDLIGLQEASLWQTTASPPPTLDSLQSLLDALKGQGLHYTLVAELDEFHLQGPSSLGFDVAVTDRDAILARQGQDAPVLSNIQKQHFHASATISTIAGPVTIQRGWLAVDAKSRGRSFRFLTTHLEPNNTDGQVAQGNELIQGPAKTLLPVIFAGDFNSAAAGGPNRTPTYGNLLKAGLIDAWQVVYPRDPGYTWPLHGEDPFTASSTPTERTDLVLFRGLVAPRSAQLIGNTKADLTPSGLWPSDHVGVVASLVQGLQ